MLVATPDGGATVSGGDGNDLIYGGDGPDLLIGDAGGNTLFGGKGDDVYIVQDGGDRMVELDLEELTRSGTGAFDGHAGELRDEEIGNYTFVSGDTNGDGLADFMIRVDGQHAFTSSDFVL